MSVPPTDGTTTRDARIDKALYAALVLATGYGKTETARVFDEAREDLAALLRERDEVQRRAERAEAALGEARDFLTTLANLPAPDANAIPVDIRRAARAVLGSLTEGEQ